jgi:hypothetical protein
MFRNPQVILFSEDLPRAVAFYAGPHEWLGRLLIAWVADPDGNPIQIVQDL